ncbi:methionyl-tRNA formyltransferase [Mycoplasma procyoni]|nr:methionyl-tRNA formyltransferase [Mycoplasma procyoni]MBN3534596.1 methionyl-tRNA formyltransferase [Mycoplasma procyoni]
MNKKIKIVLAGTPEFSVPIFEEIINNFDVVAIVSQPDRPANRGYKLEPTPTKLLAQKYNIQLFQPEKISQIYDQLAQLNFDFFVSAAFGQWVPEKVLKLAKKASVNVHGSLLPKYRGASPIQYTLLNGDSEAGITLIYMTKEMDAGDMIAKASILVKEEDTSLELFKNLSELAKNNIVSWLSDLYNDKLVAQKQDESLVSLSPKISKEFAQIFKEDKLIETYRKIKALNDNPGCFMFDSNNKRIKIFRASLQPLKNALKIELSDGILYAYEYQFEGKKKVNILSK